MYLAHSAQIYYLAGDVLALRFYKKINNIRYILKTTFLPER